ncbi:MAG TPA: hemolysin III family protein [Elusimicrobiota bacterium]|nr:hemolysin III family protein [Elusimicrobiota bacterium]
MPKTGIRLLDPESGEPRQTFGEELANSISHGVAFLAAAIAGPFLIVHAARAGRAADAVGASIFVAAIAFLYLGSTLYHALPHGAGKRAFRMIEHMAIFILIAGTYTPFTLGVLRGDWGWTLFGLIWGLAAIGLALKTLGPARFPAASLTLYLLMGWVVVFAVGPLWHRMAHRGFWWLAFGGLAYTGGVAFYTADHRLRYGHLIWHLFVIAGTLCHFAAVYWYAF